VYTLNLRIKKAATSEKTMGYGFNLFEKIWFYSKLTLDQSRLASETYFRRAMFIMVIISAFGILVAILIGISVGRNLSARTGALATRANRIASGTIEEEAEEAAVQNDELGILSRALNNTLTSFRQVTELAEEIAAGDFTRRLERRSENDPLVDAINQMTENLAEIVRQADVIASGDYTADIIIRSEKDKLRLALQNMTISLRERKQAKDALRESEERYRALVENANDSILVIQDDILKFHNAMTEEKTGYSSEELANTLFINLVHPEDRDMVNERYERRLKKEKLPASHSFRVVNKAGEELWVHLNSTVISWDGRPATLNFIRDMTQQRKLEDQFRQAQKMEAVGRLAGGVAHDFNNLLMTIIGYADLMLIGLAEDDPFREKLEQIGQNGKRAARLTRQLLAFSRKQILQPVVLDLNELIKDFVKMLKRLIGEDVELETVLVSGLRPVEADPGQMEQVIMNLVINARDAMPDGGKVIIETANTDLDEGYVNAHDVSLQPGPYVMLVVSDTGTGMDEETRSNIFEPFFTTKEVGKGTGLGLSTVYGIVKQSGGNIWVYSEPGQGTTFKIYLPAVAGETVQRKKEQPPTDDLTGSETILIVEDDDMLRNLAREILQLQGYRILDAENGIEALRISEEHRGQIHLMITDVVMPKMGGKKVADRLQPLYPQVKVIYMSGYTDNSIAHHGILAPGLNFLQKPFSPEVLARKVREVLDA